MTTTAVAAAPRPRWLFGPLPDLMLGCGLAYLAVFLVLAFAGAEVQALVPPGLLLLGGLFTGTPHYGATLLRVYERAEDRGAYRFFALWATLAVALAFAAGARDARIASALFTIYVTWNAWHYTGQNYGIALMFLGRRGVEIGRLEKRLVYATFVLSYLLIFLDIHRASASGGYAPQTADGGGTVVFVPFGIPADVATPATAAVAVAYLFALTGAGVRLARRAALRDLGPAALLVLVQAVWFVIPVLARATGTFQSVLPLAQSYQNYAFFWVAYAHAIQYLWITTYYAQARNAQVRGISFFTKSVLAGAAIWGIPVFVFAPQALGSLPYESGIFLLVASVVNIHHFILDGAIWKLRDGRIARVLIRNERIRSEAAPGRGLVRRLVWVAGAACAVVYLIDTWERHFGYAAAYVRHDTRRVETAVRRLGWLGRDGSEPNIRLAELLASDGRVPEAMDHLRRSIEFGSSARAWTQLGALHEQRGEWQDALAAYDAALAVTPGHVPALYRSSIVLLRLGRTAPARARLEQARALAPEDGAVVQALSYLSARGSR